MSVNSISSGSSYVDTKANSGTATKATTDAVSNAGTSTTTSAKTNDDVYEKGVETGYDKTAAQKAIKAAEQSKAESFKMLVSSMMKSQYSKYVQAMPSSNIGEYFANLEVDPQTQAQAKEDISEDGYWGVKKTGERILDFAKAIAGDDIDKLNEMKDAVEKGFKVAEDMWGGELPEISGQTYDYVMKGFDEWEKSITGASE